MNAYQEAAEEYAEADAAFVKASKALANAEQRLYDAAANLARYESRPGIPLPEYRPSTTDTW